jgi:hypothetical protein
MYLAMFIIIIVCSIIFKIHGDISYIPFHGGIEIPQSCFIKTITGHDCPTCGITRSFIAIGHGDLGAALKYNPAGALAYLVCLEEIFKLILEINT